MRASSLASLVLTSTTFALLGCAIRQPTADDEGAETSGESEGVGTYGETAEDASDSASDDSTATLDDGSLPDFALVEDTECTHLEHLIQLLQDEGDADEQAALISSFIAEVSYGDHGFPLRCNSREFGAIYRGESGLSLSVVGDFNDWTPGALVFDEIVPGFYAAFDSDLDELDGLYKFESAGEYFADPLARRFGWDAFGEYAQIDAIPGRSHHERWPDFDMAAGELAPRDITVYLPAAAQSEPALRVLYMHDGQNLFAPDALWGGWQVSETLDEAIAAALIDPLIVVGVDNTPARMDEYTQVEDEIDGTVYGGLADAYADFLVEGVQPFVASRYALAPAPEGAAVMGASLGGLVSLYIAQRHPEHFSALASMSGTVTWGSIGLDNPTIIDGYAQDPPEGLRIYLDSGGGPGLGCPEDGADNYCGNLELADSLRALGWVDELDLFYRWTPDAPHNESAWAERLLPALLDWWP